jgi:hypothetical protein
MLNMYLYINIITGILCGILSYCRYIHIVTLLVIIDGVCIGKLDYCTLTTRN